MLIRALFATWILLATLVTHTFAAGDCYQILMDLKFSRMTRERLDDRSPQIILADGTRVPIARAWEKEGLLYSDIFEWFPAAGPQIRKKFITRFEKELDGKAPPRLLNWLKRYSEYYRARGVAMPAKKWAKLTPHQQMKFLLSHEDPFALISVKGREALFFSDILSFDDLAPSAKTPKCVTVCDDMGSYELKTSGGIVDRNEFFDHRDQVEKYLEGRVGHQHAVHAWPVDAEKRTSIAGRYIELLDSGTWYLYWRQAKRNPNEVDSIITHDFLGIYNRLSLERLYQAVISGDVKRFNNKFRMIGARRFRADPALGQGEGWVPDFELRSGNKGPARDFMQDLIEARIASGDYNALRDFTSYQFDASARIEMLTIGKLSLDEIGVLKDFEKLHPMMKFSEHPRAYNHSRNKIIAPLLPWNNRLNIEWKKALLEEEQKKYALNLVQIARKYLRALRPLRRPETIRELQRAATDEIEAALYKFADTVRLDLDFKHYLTPRPNELPPITVTPSGDIDVNRFAVGIENSFRFPTKINSREEAEREILRMAENLRDLMGGGKIEKMSEGGHGHGLSVRYRYIDPQGLAWRVEWDGVIRDYVDGKAVNARGGHIEVPSPKFIPETMEQFRNLYQAARLGNLTPKRSAGGGHFNLDFNPIFELPDLVAATKLANFIRLYESERAMFTFLWRHPKRERVAPQIELSQDAIKRLNKFRGDRTELAHLLYEIQYFNPYISRKPRYVEMDVTGLIQPVLPKEYQRGTLDIKNKDTEWFPDFGLPKDRAEGRLFDAPEDEYFVALQILHMRGFADKAFNAPEPIKLERMHPDNAHEQWRKDPKLFIEEAQAHLRRMGLDPKWFKPLIYRALEIQEEEPWKKQELQKYEKFLPPTTFINYEFRLVA